MSKILDINVNCPKCGNQYPAKVFRTLWGDGCNADNFETRLNDKTNVVTCPHCGYSLRAPLGLMYVDCDAGFAVWWEPMHDDGIDSDTKGYAAMFGADSYYAKAPRVKDWDEFKQTIRKYYTGELTANPIAKLDFNALKQQLGNTTTQKKKKGCLGTLILLIAGTASVIGASCWGISHLLAI